MEIREWSRLQEAKKTVAHCMSFFTKAFKNRMEETLQGALLANAAASHTTPPAPPASYMAPPQLTGKWDYCHTHGLCQHSGATCKFPAPHHKQEATLDNPMGGSAQI